MRFDNASRLTSGLRSRRNGISCQSQSLSVSHDGREGPTDLFELISHFRCGYVFPTVTLYVPAYISTLGMAGYNLTREVEDLLERIEPLPPSFTVHLHPDYWTLNSGSKWLYNNQVAVSAMCIAVARRAEGPLQSLLDDIRVHRIPVDFLELFDSARLPFYDGVYRSVLCRNLAHVILSSDRLSRR